MELRRLDRGLIAAGPAPLEASAPVPALRLSRSAAPLLALTGLAAVVRFADLGGQSYWFDEAHTVWLLHHPLGSMVGHLAQTETTPPLYFIVAWLWVHVFGYGEAGLRSLSAVAGVLTVPVAYAVGVTWRSRRAGLILAALTACSPVLIWYSQEARAYACMVLLTSVALLAFVHLRAQPSRGWAITWAIAAMLAMGTHYYAALALIPQAVWLLYRLRTNRIVRLAVELAGAASALLIPLLLMQISYLSRYDWFKLIPLATRAVEVPVTFVAGPSAIGGPWLAVAGGACVLVAIGLVLARADPPERRAVAFIARLVLAGTGVVLALILLGFDQLDYRNLLALWLPAALVITGGLSLRRAGRTGVAVAAALCLLGLASAVGVAAESNRQRPDWRAVARVLSADGTRAAYMVDGCHLLPLSVYVPGLRFAPAPGVPVPEVDVITAAGQDNWTAVLRADSYVQCRPTAPGQVVPRQLGQLRERGGPVHIGLFTVTRLTSARPDRISRSSFAAAGLPGALLVIGPGSASAPSDASIAP